MPMMQYILPVSTKAAVFIIGIYKDPSFAFQARQEQTEIQGFKEYDSCMIKET